MRSSYRTTALVLGGAAGIVGVSFGALAVAAGISPLTACAMSVIVFAGGSQLAATSVLAAGGSPIAAVASGLLLNSRYIAFGFAVAPRFAGVRARERALAAHLLVDESAALALAQRDPTEARGAYRASGLAVFVFWNIGAALGAYGGNALGDANALGLDAASPAAILAMLVPQLDSRRARAAAAIAAVIALAGSLVLPPGLPVLIAATAPVLAMMIPPRRSFLLAAEGAS
jgi:4-azaleucine resistance transporter AzlC